jgi:hypothetical protein
MRLRGSLLIRSATSRVRLFWNTTLSRVGIGIFVHAQGGEEKRVVGQLYNFRDKGDRAVAGRNDAVVGAHGHGQGGRTAYTTQVVFDSTVLAV